MMTLYYAPKSCSLAVHIALEKIGADYYSVKIDFSQEQQKRSEYLSINPKARVPALKINDTVITETPAILFYLCQRFPLAQLAPLDDIEALAIMQAFNAYLCATVHVAHAHRFRGTRWVDESETEALEAMKRKVPQSMGHCMALIEEQMLVGPWVMGEQFTVADIYLYTIATWLEGDSVDTTKLPRVMTHRERMRQDPIVQKIQSLY